MNYIELNSDINLDILIQFFKEIFLSGTNKLNLKFVKDIKRRKTDFVLKRFFSQIGK